VKASDATPFARFLPELSFAIFHMPDGESRVYSLVHNREHDNVSWITGEELRLAPEEDSLTVHEGFLGAYPNMFFIIDAGDADAFAQAVASIRSPDEYARLVDRYGVKRTDQARFWPTYDLLVDRFHATEPVRAGAIDLTRYDLARP